MHRCFVQGVISAVALFASAGSSAFAQVEWMDITSATDDFPTSFAIGEFGGIFAGQTVSYTGGAEFVITSINQPNFWNSGTPYTSAGVPNAPSLPDLVALGSSNRTHVLTFSEPVTNPVMAIVSLGQPSVLTEWDFNAPFDVLSFGAGFFGNGSLSQLPGDVLVGNEGHGTIQFQGTFTSISWTVTNGESWTGFTVGLVVPAPGSAACMLGFAAMLRRRRR